MSIFEQFGAKQSDKWQSLFVT